MVTPLGGHRVLVSVDNPLNFINLGEMKWSPPPRLVIPGTYANR